jgi:hypothetical protein
MDGTYQRNKKPNLKIVNNWVTYTIKNSMWEKYYDLHIDEISEVFKDKESWIVGSMYIRESIKKKLKKEPYDLLLIISLNCKGEPQKIPNSIFEINEDLNITPPSFYLFPKKDRILADTISAGQKIEILSMLFNCDVYYKEEFDVNEYVRMLYLI